jgi:hypothetical protein
MVNQQLQDGGSSVLPATQQLTIFSIAKSPDLLPHPIFSVLASILAVYEFTCTLR